MTKQLFLFTAVAAAALAGCSKESTSANEAAANAVVAPVVLPPSIVASKIYRCKDNSVVYIDWLSDSKSANFRAERSATPTRLAATEAGGALTAEGYSLIGLPTASTVTIERPGKGSQACKA